MTHMFKRAAVASAVASAMAAGLVVAPATQAASLTQNGLGEVAMVPYYTARNNIDTYISMVNTDPLRTALVKILFYERDNTREVRDFMIALSPNDVWTGVVTMRADGVPVVQTSDNSCTLPTLLESEATVAGMRGIGFTNIGYDGTSTFPHDSGDTSIARTYDGHFAVYVVGMGDTSLPLPAAAVHTASGVPANCALLVDNMSRNGPGGETQPGTFKAEFTEPENVLKVAANLIRVDAGVAAMIPVDMIANFFNPEGQTLDAIGNPVNPFPQGVDGLSTLDIIPTPENTDPKPELRFMEPDVTVQISPSGEIVLDDWSFPYVPVSAADPVSSLFSATSVINEYAVGGAANALYDWVVTFPTKRYYADSFFAGNVPLPPFNDLFQADALACEPVSFGYFNREEGSISTPQGLNFSPAPPGAPGNSICQETNILAFASTSVLAGTVTPALGNVYGVPLDAAFTSGWMRLTFTGFNATSVGILGQNYRYLGLPVHGFGIKTYTNGTAGAARLDYGFTQEHAYARNIIALP